MNDSLTHQDYISYTLHNPHQQSMSYSVGGNGSQQQQQQQQQLASHQQQQQQYVMQTHSDLLQQAASGLLATEAPDGPLMMSSTVGTGGVLLTLNGTNGPIHNGSTSLQHQTQFGSLTNSSNSPLSGVLVSTNGNGTTVLGSPQPNSQSGQSSQRSSSSNGTGNSNSTNTSPTVHHSSKKKRKSSSIVQSNHPQLVSNVFVRLFYLSLSHSLSSFLVVVVMIGLDKLVTIIRSKVNTNDQCFFFR